MSKNFVTGFFKTRAAAEAAVDAIIKRGYTRDDISVLMSDATKNKEFAVQTRSHAADGLGIGGAIGGTVGARLSRDGHDVLLCDADREHVEAINASGLSIEGPVEEFTARAPAVLPEELPGGATGGLIGMLVGAGIPEHRAKVYDAGVRGGGILLGIEAKSKEEVDKLKTLLEDIGAEHVQAE